MSIKYRKISKKA